MLLGPHQQRQIAADTAIAGETIVRTKNRQARQRQIKIDAIAVATAEATVAKRQPRFDHIGERAPIAALVLGNRQIDEALADKLGGVARRRLRAFRHRGEAQRRVHLPEPVGGGFGIVAQPVLVLGIGFRRRVGDDRRFDQKEPRLAARRIEGRGGVAQMLRTERAGD